ncbi:MAG: P22 coat - protein 5 family protein [Deltaproteobacteria bacterium]|nr:P22 coat - protein 5 family protein [Deltaproteobacteria bacterium]
MGNTLTGLIQYINDSADIVSRELVGMIPSVYLNPKAEMAALNQDITYPVVPTMAAEDTTPGATPPALGDQTVGAGTMRITKSRTVRFYWSGEDETAMGATMRTMIENNKFAQAFRTLTNEMESDLAGLYVSASRAYGTAGTTPFATAGDFSDAAEIVRILKDNGAPTTDLQLVINTAAGAKIIGKQAQAQITGSDNIQRQGILLDIAGCKIRESAAIKNTTKGTGASYVTNGSTAPGVADIALITGSGTVVAGDIATFAADAVNKYVVKTGVAAPGTISLGAPGARMTIPTGNALTIGNGYAANMAFDRSAIHLLARLPKLPSEGDIAADEYIMIDPVSGLPFRIALYKGYQANQIAISIAWGVKAVKSENIALLLG